MYDGHETCWIHLHCGALNPIEIKYTKCLSNRSSFTTCLSSNLYAIFTGCESEVITSAIPDPPSGHHLVLDSEQFRDLIRHLKLMSAFGESMVMTQQECSNIRGELHNFDEHKEEFFLPHTLESRKIEGEIFFRTLCVMLSRKLHPWHAKWNPGLIGELFV